MNLHRHLRTSFCKPPCANLVPTNSLCLEEQEKTRQACAQAGGADRLPGSRYGRADQPL